MIHMVKPGVSVLNCAQGKWNRWWAAHHFIQFKVQVFGKINRILRLLYFVAVIVVAAVVVVIIIIIVVVFIIVIVIVIAGI